MHRSSSSIGWSVVAAALAVSFGVSSARAGAALQEGDVEVAGERQPRFELQLGRSPVQAGFALDLSGGAPFSWAQLALESDGAPALRSLVALDEHGRARVVQRNYSASSEVRATCRIPFARGESAAVATLEVVVPPAPQMVQRPNGPQFVLGAGDIVITEIMKDPSFVADSAGEWFEIRNRMSQPVDLEGWSIRDAAGNQHTIHGTNGVWVPARAYFVLGINSNPAQNGGVQVGYKYSSFSLGNGADDIQLVDASGLLIDAVAYDDGIFWPDEAGKSLNLERGSIDSVLNDDGANWCPSLNPFLASNTDLGTPRVANNTCQ